MKRLLGIREFARRLFWKAPSDSPLEIERAERIFYLRYLQPGMTVFDVGANIGELTFLFSKAVRKGEVHSFEPVVNTFERLTTICETAALKNVVLRNIALAEKTGKVNMNVYDEAHSSWNTRAVRDLKSYGIDIMPVSIEEVQAITIDEYCQKNNVLKIDLLKIDVEGAENQVLLGARQMFVKRTIQCCVFESGRAAFDMGNDPNDIVEFFAELNYELHNLISGRPVFLGDVGADKARFGMYIAYPKGSRFDRVKLC